MSTVNAACAFPQHEPRHRIVRSDLRHIVRGRPSWRPRHFDGSSLAGPNP